MPTVLREPLTVAVRSSRELCRLLSTHVRSSRPTLMRLLTDTTRAIEACPNFTRPEMCYFRNRLTSCRRLLGQGEWGAARYEMTELSRKLARAQH
jgi:hypothetical protein